MDEQLRQIYRTSGVWVSFDTTNTCDSFYRDSVDFVLNVCGRNVLVLQKWNNLDICYFQYLSAHVFSWCCNLFMNIAGPKVIVLLFKLMVKMLSKHSCCNNCVGSCSCMYSFTIFTGMGNFWARILLIQIYIQS